MLGNTLVVTIGATPVTLVKINQDNYASEYRFRDAVGEVSARVRHAKTGGAKNGPALRDRHNFELTETVYATDTEPERVRKCYFVVEQSPSDINVDVPKAAFALATASSAAFLNSLMAWES